MSEIRNHKQASAVTSADAIMLRLLDLHSQGYSLTEACYEVGVDEGYWRRHQRTFLAALGAVNVPHAVRRAFERGLVAA